MPCGCVSITSGAIYCGVPVIVFVPGSTDKASRTLDKPKSATCTRASTDPCQKTRVSSDSFDRHTNVTKETADRRSRARRKGQERAKECDACLDALVSLDEQIKRLEIAVDQVCVMHRSQTVHGIQQIAKPYCPWQSLLVLIVTLASFAMDDLEQRAALHKLHHYSGRGIKHAVASHDARMVYSCHLADFNFKLCQGLVIHGRAVCLVLFDGYRVLLILTLEDVAYRATSDLAADRHL